MAKKIGRADQMDKLDHLLDAPPETDDGDQMLKDAHLNAAPPETAAATDLRHVTQVRVTSNGHGLMLQQGDVLVICRDPGFRRAGIAHDAVRVYPAGALAPATLTALRHEPQLEIVEVG
ncbi:hypothetical protein CGLAMM_11355 [Acetobacteraceae bacterium EV16G]|uniref:Uncharacterized protein n=1 Tax=Sorlinia euscelidii TaxID=3081148 RepID=A0ABU7U1C2_9PROT